MRLSEFWALAEAEFGRAHAHSLAGDLVLRTLGDRTAAAALAAGTDPAAVWSALCEELDVPQRRRGGPVPPDRTGAATGRAAGRAGDRA